MTDREKLEKLKACQMADHAAAVKVHEASMAVIDQLLSIVDPDTGMFPAVFVELMSKDFGVDLAVKPQADLRPLDPPSLEDTIYALMETGQDTYFTADKSWSPRQIYLMLESRGYPFPQGIDAGINSVSTVLIRMMDKSILERTIKGSGRAPSLYRWIRAEDRPSTTARNYSHILPISMLVEPANIQGSTGFGGFSTDLYDATRSGVKGSLLGSFLGPTVASSWDELSKKNLKEKEDPEESP